MMTHKEAHTRLFDVFGRVALVNGGCRGLGLAMSEGLATAGAKLACIDIADECDELRNSVEAHGADLAYVRQSGQEFFP